MPLLTVVNKSGEYVHVQANTVERFSEVEHSHRAMNWDRLDLLTLKRAPADGYVVAPKEMRQFWFDNAWDIPNGLREAIDQGFLTIVGVNGNFHDDSLCGTAEIERFAKASVPSFVEFQGNFAHNVPATLGGRVRLFSENGQLRMRSQFDDLNVTELLGRIQRAPYDFFDRPREPTLSLAPLQDMLERALAYPTDINTWRPFIEALPAALTSAPQGERVNFMRQLGAILRPWSNEAADYLESFGE